ncbi:hypothetical protein CSKR_111062, partial [Clonorchis sinensis]
NVLSNERVGALRELKKSEDNVVLKPDKGSGDVGLNKLDLAYCAQSVTLKLEAIVSPAETVSASTPYEAQPTGA